jgi:calcium/calmodulin-dependent protein kinase I
MGNSITLCPTDFLYGDEDFEAQYEVDEANYIGTGKFSVVHLCWRRAAPEKRYALKVITTRPDDHASLTRIYEEVNILKGLGNHPSIIQLVDMDDGQSNTIRLVLELCEGGELFERIQQKQFYPENEAKVLVRNLLEAVAFIHSKGIMHRDLKPENILLSSKVSNTDIKISDFGLAKISKDYPRRLPRSHSICGSDFYLAPEVIKQEEYGREIDIWSVGVVAYVVMSGSLPFFHNVLHKLYRQIVERDLSFPEQAWKTVAKGAQDFILRLLQVRPGDRLTAEQATNHPWLRGAGSPANSFTSDYTGRPGAANYYGGASNFNVDSRVAGGSYHTPYPLEHAHKVNSNSGQASVAQAQQQAGPYGYAARR